MNYTAHAEWDTTGWWVITVEDIPGANSQCRRLDQVESNAREIIELLTGNEPDEVSVKWTMPGEVGTRAEELADLRERAEDLADATAIETRRLVPELRAAGMSYRDIGTMTGISHQRAQQIAKQNNDPVVSWDKLKTEIGATSL